MSRIEIRNLTAVKDNADFDFGVAMLPASKRRGTPTGGGNFYIFKQTTPDERRAAMQLIKFMTGPENSAKWSTHHFMILPRKSGKSYFVCGTGKNPLSVMICLAGPLCR